MALFGSLFTRSLEQQRLKALAKAPAGPVHDYLSTPLPAPETPVDELPLLAIDLETSGLNPTTDRLLSIGFVPVEHGEVRLGGARHILVRQALDEHGRSESVGESATIHGLTDDALIAGVPLAEALALTLAALRGRALLAHFTSVEVGFLTAACEQVFGARPVFCDVDTMHIQYRMLTTGFDDEPPRSALRLWGARARYGLPVYKAHEALTDALACAELYLALVAEPGAGATLADLRR